MTRTTPFILASQSRRLGAVAGKHPTGKRGPYNQHRITSGIRRCNRCRLVKPLAAFFRQGRTYKSLCKPCDQTRAKTDYAALNRAARHRRWLILRAQVFWHYGTVCACCSEPETDFLTIDHIEGDGAEHRRQIGESSLYHWLRKNGFPPGFQTLCRNCNWAKHRLGTCPHRL